MCGENAVSPIYSAITRGSPPRVRGKRAAYAGTATPRRITPACAGKTWRERSGFRRTTDHPRVCGENVKEANVEDLVFGSPPRVRGKPVHLCVRCHTRRITPACAGKTSHSASLICPSADHPRVCGENAFRCSPFRARNGSPPRVRGKRAAS